jgi:hypothetical protein
VRFADTDETDFFARDEIPAEAAAAMAKPAPEPPLSDDPSAIVWSIDIPYSNRFERRNLLRLAPLLGALPALLLAVGLYVAVRSGDIMPFLFLVVLLGAAAALSFFIIRASGNKVHDGTFVVSDEGVLYAPGKSEQRLAVMSAALGASAGRPSAVTVAQHGAQVHTVLWKNVVRAKAYEADHVIELYGRLGPPLFLHCTDEVWTSVLDAIKAHLSVEPAEWK